MRSFRILSSVLLVLLILSLGSTAFAQSSGKIKGIVTDSETGEAVIGANVTIEGTSKGASTDLDGVFFIVAVTPGEYTVKASALGFATATYTGVEIRSDETTELEFKLQEQTLELGEVTLVYEAPEVNLGVTSKEVKISGEDLAMKPTDDVTAALVAEPGFKIDDEGKIHIRGGRDTESRFIVDGIDSRDPITGEVLPVNLAAVNVQEIQILTGGMAAEYGNATAGIVNITTPEGAVDGYSGSIAWSTDIFSDDVFDDFSFNEDRVDIAYGGPVPVTGMLFNRPITFYVTGNVKLSDTYTPLGLDYGSQDYAGLGFDVPRRQYNDWSGSMKLAYDLGSGKKVSIYMMERARVFDVYPNGAGFVSGNYGWQYLYNLEHRPQAEDRRTSFNIDFTNQLSSRSVMNFSVGRQVLTASLSPRGKNPGEFTLVDEIEENIATGIDQNNNGRWDQDADGDGVVHSETFDELGFDNDGNNFLDGYFDHDGNQAYEGENEGYEDLNMNGQWDRGEDWIDLNGNGVYDFAEPWTDRADPVTGVNNIGVFDPWDPYIDLNGDGVWNPAEPQLAEQDMNGNGRWMVNVTRMPMEMVFSIVPNHLPI